MVHSKIQLVGACLEIRNFSQILNFSFSALSLCETCRPVIIVLIAKISFLETDVIIFWSLPIGCCKMQRLWQKSIFLYSLSCFEATLHNFLGTADTQSLTQHVHILSSRRTYSLTLVAHNQVAYHFCTFFQAPTSTLKILFAKKSLVCAISRFFTISFRQYFLYKRGKRWTR